MEKANDFTERLAAFGQWRSELTEVIRDYYGWLDQQGLTQGDENGAILDLVQDLRSEKLRIALVAEFSRGKSELINAIFFAEHGQRLLPTAAGRTTMCPTELLYDANEDPCIRLLPIETRKTKVSIADYKHTFVHWKTIHIHNLKSTKDISAAFQEITRTKTVSLREAHELGLYKPSEPGPVSNSETMEVPAWRHAIINFPHPLLMQGLVILDTPGLNALGAEPELTLSMLPEAHAVLFVLGADTGVSKSDLDVWRNHVVTALGESRGRFAVLNKIDVLWDELSEESDIAAALQQQIREAAHALQLDERFIFPISAQKGLLAKVKGDAELLQKSGLPALEAMLANQVLPGRQEYLRAKIVHQIGTRVHATKVMVDHQLATLNGQIDELTTLGGKNRAAIEATAKQLRQEKARYDEELKSFEKARTKLSGEAAVLLAHLNTARFDALAASARADMQERWTTHGMKSAMQSLFGGIVAEMEKAASQAKQISAFISESYTRFHAQFGLPEMQPAAFSLIAYVTRLKQLEAKAERFRNNPMTTMTEQHFVIDKFFATLVSEARGIFSDCHAGAKSWFQALITPPFMHIRQHKRVLDQRLENVKKIHENLDNVSVKIAELELERQSLEQQNATIDTLLERLMTTRA